MFGGNVVLSALIARHLTSSRTFGILGAVLFLLSAPMMIVHSFALSEPLFLFLSYLVILALFLYLSPHRLSGSGKLHWLWLVAAGVLTSLGYLTRYVGISLYAVSLLALSIFARSWSKWIKDFLIFLASSAPGAVVWSLRNLSVTGNAANRPIFFHPLPPDKWYEGLRNFWGWLLPGTSSLPDRFLLLLGIILAGILALLAAGVIVYAVRCWQGKVVPGSRAILTVIIALNALLYLALLIVAMNFFDDKTIFEHRILSPFYVCVLSLVVAGLAWLWERLGISGRVASIALALGMLLSFVSDSVGTVNMLHQAGQGYASGRWRNSETIEAVKSLPQVKVFSNKITALYILADRPGYIIPWRFTGPSEPDPSYEAGVKEYQKQVMNGEAVVVIFDYREEVASGNERVIDITSGLPVLGMYDDGAIFGPPLQ